MNRRILSELTEFLDDEDGWVHLVTELVSREEDRVISENWVGKIKRGETFYNELHTKRTTAHPNLLKENTSPPHYSTTIFGEKAGGLIYLCSDHHMTDVYMMDVYGNRYRDLKDYSQIEYDDSEMLRLNLQAVKSHFHRLDCCRKWGIEDTIHRISTRDLKK